MAKYLLTGAAGFIGCYTARILLDRGDEVVGIDNLNDYYDPRIKKHRLEVLRHYDSFSFQAIDVEDALGIEALFEANPDFIAVFHLAARAGVRYSVERPDIYAATNLNGTVNMLESARRREIKKFILASTSSLYADEPMPFSEDAPANKPRSPYAASKKAAEAMAYSYHHLYGMDVTVVRYFTVYGPAGRPDMSPLRFIRWIDEGIPITLYGDGSQGRDFTYIEDIARGTVLAETPLGYEIINLGRGAQPVQMNEFISIIEEILQKKAVIDEKPFIGADMKDTWADISKAKSLLGWEPKVDLRSGLEKSVAWYKENRNWLNKSEF